MTQEELYQRIVEDRLSGLTFVQIAKKRELRHATMARAYYQNGLAEIVKNAPDIRFTILKHLKGEQGNKNTLETIFIIHEGDKEIRYTQRWETLPYSPNKLFNRGLK